MNPKGPFQVAWICHTPFKPCRWFKKVNMDHFCIDPSPDRSTVPLWSRRVGQHARAPGRRKQSIKADVIKQLDICTTDTTLCLSLSKCGTAAVESSSVGLLSSVYRRTVWRSLSYYIPRTITTLMHKANLSSEPSFWHCVPSAVNLIVWNEKHFQRIYQTSEYVLGSYSDASNIWKKPEKVKTLISFNCEFVGFPLYCLCVYLSSYVT